MSSSWSAGCASRRWRTHAPTSRSSIRLDSSPLTSDGATRQQHTVVSTLESIEHDVLGATPTAIAVVGDVVRLRDRLSWWETKPLFGWRVLVPRTKEQSGSLSEQLISYGAVP